MTLPWAYIRRQIAERWHCPPWEVDSAPWYDLQNELTFMGIESRVAEWKKQHNR